MLEWLSMGGYGRYIWPAYIITLLVFVIVFVISCYERNRIKKIVKNYHQ